MKKHALTSSVIREKVESQDGCLKETSTSDFPKNELFLPPDRQIKHYPGKRILDCDDDDDDDDNDDDDELFCGMIDRQKT